MDIVAFVALVLVAVVYSWAAYNVPLLLVGVRSYQRGKHRSQRLNEKKTGVLPFFSVVVPAKNEEKVLPRLLHALLSQQYPRGKIEIIVVEDGSTDSTVEVCRKFADRSRGIVRLVRAGDSKGKPYALNCGLKAAQGDIIAVFDADSVPEKDAFLNAAKHFEDKQVAALQGRTLTVNSEVNMLTRFVSFEDAVYCEAYLRGREALGLFVHLRGTCQFVRREILERVGGWREDYLSDDFEMSARLTEQGYRIKYASDVQSWQESPQGVGQMLRQRLRWFRGAMEVALSYGRLMRKPSLKSLDAEMTLLAPFVLILSLLCYILGPIMFHSFDQLLFLAIGLVGWTLLTASIVLGAIAMLYVARPRKFSDMLWIPFIYAYWSFQVLLAVWALGEIIFRYPREWRRTSKTGIIAAARFPIEATNGSRN